MASLWKHPQSKFWSACWTDKDGRRLKRSTKTTDRKLAKKLAEQFEAESRVVRTAKQARQILAEIYREHSGQELATSSVADYFNGYVARRKPEIGKASFEYYKGNARRFLAYLGDRANADIAQITKGEITAYRDHIRQKIGPRTTNNVLKCLKAFFTAARKDGFLIEDPAGDVATVRDREETNRRPFTLPEIKTLIGVVNSEWKSMILFGLYTGQRLQDIATLGWNNLDLTRGVIRLTTSKTGRRMELPIAAPLRIHIESLNASDDPKEPLHPTAAGHVRRTGRAARLSNQFGELLLTAGLRSPAQNASSTTGRAKNELSFHSLRHTATSLLKAAGIPASVVMEFIGHDDAKVSQGYTHTGSEALELAAAALPNLL
jgi:integrase